MACLLILLLICEIIQTWLLFGKDFPLLCILRAAVEFIFAQMWALAPPCGLTASSGKSHIQLVDRGWQVCEHFCLPASHEFRCTRDSIEPLCFPFTQVQRAFQAVWPSATRSVRRMRRAGHRTAATSLCFVNGGHHVRSPLERRCAAPSCTRIMHFVL